MVEAVYPEAEPPHSLLCVVCHFDVPVDDITTKRGDGVVCCACAARMTGDQHTRSKAYQREIDAFLASLTGFV